MKYMVTVINMKLTPIGVEYQQIIIFCLPELVDIDKYLFNYFVVGDVRLSISMHFIHGYSHSIPSELFLVCFRSFSG